MVKVENATYEICLKKAYGNLWIRFSTWGKSITFLYVTVMIKTGNGKFRTSAMLVLAHTHNPFLHWYVALINIYSDFLYDP